MEMMEDQVVPVVVVVKVQLTLLLAQLAQEVHQTKETPVAQQGTVTRAAQDEIISTVAVEVALAQLEELQFLDSLHHQEVVAMVEMEKILGLLGQLQLQLA